MKSILSLLIIAMITSMVSCKKDVAQPAATKPKTDAVKPAAPVYNGAYDYQKAIMAKRTLTPIN